MINFDYIHDDLLEELPRGCCILGKDGCRINISKRPQQTRMMIPNSEGHKYPNHSLTHDWRRHRHSLCDLYLLL